MALRVLKRGVASTLRGVRARGCESRDVPACPPCARAPQPACRARPPTVRRAQRLVCCAPPQGSRPPCAPRVPACSLTCAYSQEKDRKTLRTTRKQVEVSSSYAIKPCDCEQDPVAQRIILARRARQAEYEREVKSRLQVACAAPAAPGAGFSLGAERECARATDGCTYAMRTVPAPRTRCGPGRTPPPPRCVELAPDDGCRIRGDAHLDPCAHRPRVMIEIDRSANAETCRTHPGTPSSKPSLGPSRGTHMQQGQGSGGRLPNWCANPPQPAPAPPRCRRPNIVERLRGRSVPCPPHPRDERRLHTSAILSSICSKTSKPAASSSSSLESMLQNKKNLKEAGVGRFVKDDCGRPPRGHKAPAGKLELRVPPGTERVAVHVSLEGAIGTCAVASLRATSSDTTCAERTSNSSVKFTETCGKQNPWMSIKSIQKKLSGCRSDDEPSGARAVAGCGAAGPRRPAAVRRCGPVAPDAPRRCSSTSAYLANTIIVNSF